MIEPPPTVVKLFNQTWFNWFSNLYNYVRGLDSETVSVKDFGALGDGVTDDTAAIQAAIATGNKVFYAERRLFSMWRIKL